VIATRNDQVAIKRFGAKDGRNGIIYTRTGRAFFSDPGLEKGVLEQVRDAMAQSGLWDELNTDWVCLDCELMPWSAKAQELLKSQYAATGAAAVTSLVGAIGYLEKAVARGGAPEELLEQTLRRLQDANSYKNSYRRYCWDATSLQDFRLAPFHLLAAEGRVYSDRDHQWHVDTLGRLHLSDSILVTTPYRVVDVTNQESAQDGVDWWIALTEKGSEGMVIKPLDWVVRGKKGLVQPALKCRGREYLRIIYGPEYTAPDNIERLRSRQLGAKRSLALREYALGLEGLNRFVAKEPLYRVHECVFGILALESEPVDPRL
jgi:protein phosphatase